MPGMVVVAAGCASLPCRVFVTSPRGECGNGCGLRTPTFYAQFRYECALCRYGPATSTYATRRELEQLRGIRHQPHSSPRRAISVPRALFHRGLLSAAKSRRSVSLENFLPGTSFDPGGGQYR